MSREIALAMARTAIAVARMQRRHGDAAGEAAMVAIARRWRAVARAISRKVVSL